MNCLTMLTTSVLSRLQSFAKTGLAFPYTNFPFLTFAFFNILHTYRERSPKGWKTCHILTNRLVKLWHLCSLFWWDLFPSLYSNRKKKEKNCGSVYLLTENWNSIAFFLSINHSFCVENKILVARSQLNKQIQLLERHIHSSKLDEERQKSHFSASTAPHTSFQFETPQQAVLRSGPLRYDAPVFVSSEPCGPSFQSFSSSSVDKYGMSLGPVERESFIPRNIEVNYIEGSGDKRWSDQNFPWTKKLEVFNYYQFQMLSNHHCFNFSVLLLGQ